MTIIWPRDLRQRRAGGRLVITVSDEDDNRRDRLIAGPILYKAAWTNPADVEHALASSLEALPRRAADKLMPAYSERLIWRAEENDRFIELSKCAGP